MARQRIQHIEHLIGIEDLTSDMFHALIKRAVDYKNGKSYHFLEPKFVANVFFDKSTRHKYSMELAQKRLGIKFIEIEGSHSVSLYDTALTMTALDVNALIVRTGTEENFSDLLNNPSINCHIINVGNGNGQNPIQTLVDLMTIYETFNCFEGLKVGFIGDVQHSRSAHSNCQALHHLGCDLYFSGPSELVENYAHQYGQRIEIEQLLKMVDVVMVYRSKTLVQPEACANYMAEYGLTLERANQIKNGAIIMHPGPIMYTHDIEYGVVELPCARIMTQLKNSMYMNMAILEAILT